MLELKTKMATAVILAILSGLLLAGASYFLFPDQPSNQMPLPKPSPSIFEQLSWALLWLGLTALISLTIVGIILLLNRAQIKKTKKNGMEYEPATT